MKIKKGDKVMVIAGKDKGKSGKVLRVLPKMDKVVVDGVNVVKRHQKGKRSDEGGQIIDKTMPIHISNVAITDPKSGKPTRIRIGKDKDGKRERIAVKSGSAIK